MEKSFITSGPEFFLDCICTKQGIKWLPKGYKVVPLVLEQTKLPSQVYNPTNETLHSSPIVLNQSIEFLNPPFFIVRLRGGSRISRRGWGFRCVEEGVRVANFISFFLNMA